MASGTYDGSIEEVPGVEVSPSALALWNKAGDRSDKLGFGAALLMGATEADRDDPEPYEPAVLCVAQGETHWVPRLGPLRSTQPIDTQPQTKMKQRSILEVGPEPILPERCLHSLASTPPRTDLLKFAFSLVRSHAVLESAFSAVKIGRSN